MKKKYTVIIVEDEPPILNSLRGMVDNSETPFITQATSFNGKDGMELIEIHKPHVVITDINMPIMDGLEMITKAKKISPDTRFIILTGYNEFEYAQVALRLEVSDYLLKPVRQKILNNLLKEIAAKIHDQDNIIESQYIKAELGLLNHGDSSVEILKNTSMHLFFVYAGNLINKSYHKFGDMIYNWELRDWTELKDELSKYCDRMHIFRGQYSNELIVAVIWDLEEVKDIRIITNIIFQWARNKETFINLGISETIKDGKSLRDCSFKAMNVISNEMKFGRDAIIKQGYSEKEYKHDISSEIKSDIKELTFMSTEEQLSKKLRRIIEYWDQQGYTTRQLITEISYMFTTIGQKAIMKISEVDYKLLENDELLILANDYEELYDGILAQLKEILISPMDISSARELVDQIQEYLDRNFTSNITYKVLEDKFGYNQRYISNIFKEEKGISPNKYITNMRINMAKTLMMQNPEILIKDIAKVVGYADQLYFSRVFKEVTGKSPSIFINEIN